MTVEDFFGEIAFDVREGYLFENRLAVAYKRPKPTLYVSKAMIEYIEKEVSTGGKVEFIRNIRLNLTHEWDPIFRPIIVR